METVYFVGDDKDHAVGRDLMCRQAAHSLVESQRHGRIGLMKPKAASDRGSSVAHHVARWP